MTSPVPAPGIVTFNVSRRRFLGGMFSAGAFVVASRFVPDTLLAAGVDEYRTAADNAALNPSVYLGIDPDGTVHIVTHRSEMGTGIRTSLPMIAADELDADWARVKIVQGIGDARYGDQNTDGSKSIRDFFDAFRQAGASARAMLIQAAAAQWGVKAAECETGLHEVVHKASGRKAPYASLVAAAAQLPVPKPETLTLKPRSAWRYIGKDHAVYDLADIVHGKAVYGMDAKVDGMVHASIERPPVLYCRGTKPSQAPKSRPRSKASPFPMAATTAVEIKGPTPGTLIRRMQLASRWLISSISRLTVSMRSSSQSQSS